MKEQSLFKRILSNFEEIIAGTFIMITTVLVVINVFLRYFMKTGLYWSEEVATICFVWSVFIGAAASYKRGQHIGVDIIVNKLPKTIRNIVIILVDLILILLNGYITYIGVIYISRSYIKPTAVLGISSAYVSSSLVVGFALMTMYSIIFLVRDFKKTKEENNA